MVDRAKFLSLEEINTVLAWLHHRRRRGRNYQLNRVIFRLSCCCGMRCTEICGLDLRYLQLDFIRIPKEITRGKRRVRYVFLNDEGSMSDLAAYKALRLNETGGDLDQPFVVGLSQNAGKRLTTDLVAKRWRSVMRVVLGKERARQLSIQCGRLS